MKFKVFNTAVYATDKLERQMEEFITPEMDIKETTLMANGMSLIVLLAYEIKAEPKPANTKKNTKKSADK